MGPHLRASTDRGTTCSAGLNLKDVAALEEARSQRGQHPYAILWGERTVRSVANLTRQDANEFLALAPQVPVRTDVHP
jgi:propanol-preferring alcohol dehydrogenase